MVEDAYPSGNRMPPFKAMSQQQEVEEALSRLNEENAAIAHERKLVEDAVSQSVSVAFPTLPNDKTDRQLLEEILTEVKPKDLRAAIFISDGSETPKQVEIVIQSSHSRLAIVVDSETLVVKTITTHDKKILVHTADESEGFSEQLRAFLSYAPAQSRASDSDSKD